MYTAGRSPGKAPVQTKTSQAHPGTAGKAEQKHLHSLCVSDLRPWLWNEEFWKPKRYVITAAQLMAYFQIKPEESSH